LPVSFSASQPIAVCWRNVPLAEAICPAKYQRKDTFVSAELAAATAARVGSRSRGGVPGGRGAGGASPSRSTARLPASATGEQRRGICHGLDNDGPSGSVVTVIGWKV
jgi:hypothetical protein